MHNALLVLALFIPLSFAGSTENDYRKYKNQTEAHEASALNAAKNFKPEQIFQNYNGSVAQQQYFTGVEAETDNLQAEAKRELAKDRAGSSVYENFTNKPPVVINKNSETIRNAENIQNQSNAIARENRVFCRDGSCVVTRPSTNPNMGQNIAALKALADGAGEYKAEREKSGNSRFKKPVTVFKGKVFQCRVHDFNFIDCCSEKGWGKKLNLAHCSREDKELGKAKLAYKAHYIGRYCHKKWPKPAKGCRIWKNSYCVFDSRLSRIIQEEGRLRQLNAGAMGSAEYPVCNGLTVDELQRIDMGQIDFIAPVYPWHEGVRDRKAGIADEIALNAPDSGKLLAATAERISNRMGQGQ